MERDYGRREGTSSGLSLGGRKSTGLGTKMAEPAQVWLLQSPVLLGMALAPGSGRPSVEDVVEAFRHLLGLGGWGGLVEREAMGLGGEWRNLCSRRRRCC